jgi:pimeloyl-ACP methyl ester carboxylesterase
MGSGEPVFILIHGFGASTFSWREVMQPLSAYGMVIAYDRPAFGLTERPLDWEEENPYTQESNIALLLGLMDAMEIQEAVLVGNSAGGTLATVFTLAHPERVLALIEVDAAVYQTIPDSPLLHWLFNTPQMDHLGPLITRRFGANAGEDFLQSAWHDPSKLDSAPTIREGYRRPLQVENWDRALWQYTQAARAPDFIENLDQINVPTLVITGDDDQIVFPEASHRLAEDIPGSVFKVIENCGHLPHEECPGEFMQIVINFLDTELEVIHE